LPAAKVSAIRRLLAGLPDNCPHDEANANHPMNANYVLLPDAISVAAAANKAEVLALMAARLAAVYDLDEIAVLEGLEEREALGSTGFGRGVALPHARMDKLARPVAALLRLDSPVDFAAADGMLVDVVIGLVSPMNAGVAHLQALAAISRLVRDEHMHRALVDATDAETLYALLTNATDRDAA
jgi:PTS system nitrogen regulatory IIA component